MKIFIQYKNGESETIWTANGAYITTLEKYGTELSWTEDGKTEFRKIEYIEAVKIS